MLARNGEIISITLKSSSGNAEFNQLAIKAIRVTAPFYELSYLSDKDYEEASTINFLFSGTNDQKCH